MEPFEVELAAFKNSLSIGQKSFKSKSRKILCLIFFYDARNAFQQMDRISFFYIRDLKPAVVTYAVLQQIL